MTEDDEEYTTKDFGFLRDAKNQLDEPIKEIYFGETMYIPFKTKKLKFNETQTGEDWLDEMRIDLLIYISIGEELSYIDDNIF